MHTQFLPLNKLKKLQIVQQLLVNKYIGVHSLSEEVQLSSTLIKKYISEINIDAQTITNTELIVKNEDNVFTIQPIVTKKYQNIYTELQLLYLNEALSFQLCKLVCGSSKIKLADICTRLSISRAHAFRTIKNLDTIAKKFNIAFELNKNGYYTFTGQELAIRIFIFNFVNQCIGFDEWIFPTTTQLEIQAQLLTILNLPYQNYSKRQITLFATVFQTRIKNHNYVPVLTDKDMRSTLERFQYFPENEIHSYLLTQGIYDENVIKTECLYLSFFARILLADSLPKDNILLIGEKFINDKKTDYNLLGNLVNSWSQESSLNFSLQQKYIFMYYCILFYTLTLLDITLLELWFLDLPDNKKNVFIDTELQKKTISFFKSFILKKDNSKNNRFWLSSKAMTNFCSLLYLTTFQTQSKQLTIYLYFTKSFNSKKYIYSFLKTNFSLSLIKFVDSPIEANIIITDRFDYPKYDRQKMVVISDFFNKAQLNMLLQSINECILD
ncbi:helix-turn-helix domain-containing protein [Enterococcus sp. AZ029]|uniref:helix-turn-helix domain-containing protein n=1 Tax=Enterococcus sp. AZ029 TaxID=2774841 RepID=UPI003F22ABAB